MKYPSIILIIICALNYNLTYAQTTSLEAEKTNKAACIKFTKDLVPDFQLNENEYIKLKSLNMLYLSKIAQSATLMQITPTGLTSPLYELEKQHELELLSFLSPSQLYAYKAYKENNKSVLRQLIETVSEATGNKEMLADISAH